MKLLFIGIDGASYRVMKRLKKRRYVSFLNTEDYRQKILYSVITKKQVEPHTGPAWSSIYTGTKPKVQDRKSVV